MLCNIFLLFIYFIHSSLDKVIKNITGSLSDSITNLKNSFIVQEHSVLIYVLLQGDSVSVSHVSDIPYLYFSTFTTDSQKWQPGGFMNV